MRTIALAGLFTGLVIPSLAYADALTAKLKPRTAKMTSTQTGPLEVEAVAQAVAIFGSIGQSIIGYGFVSEQGGLGQGVWHQTSSPIVTAVAPRSPVERFELAQNYPNPFLHNTQIRFTLPKRDKVTLRVFDVSGRAISTLVDGLLAAGEYEVFVTANSLAPGLYFYRMATSDDVFTRKMLLLDSGGSHQN